MARLAPPSNCQWLKQMPMRKISTASLRQALLNLAEGNTHFARSSFVYHFPKRGRIQSAALTHLLLLLAAPPPKSAAKGGEGEFLFSGSSRLGR